MATTILFYKNCKKIQPIFEWENGKVRGVQGLETGTHRPNFKELEGVKGNLIFCPGGLL